MTRNAAFRVATVELAQQATVGTQFAPDLYDALSSSLSAARFAEGGSTAIVRPLLAIGRACGKIFEL
jgi:hypothetical protein